MNRAEIECAIIEELDSNYLWDDHVTPESVNRGECEAFAKSVRERLNGNIKIISTADIMGRNKDNKPEPWHVWITDGERHYDAEHPQGVNSWGKLNFFKRTITKEPSLE
jgi:hypothetical protein